MLYDFSGLAVRLVSDELSEEDIDGLCLDSTKELFPFAVSAIFVREFVDQSSLEQLKTLAAAIRYQFEKTIASASWLDAKSHRVTLEKVGCTPYILTAARCGDMVSFRRAQSLEASCRFSSGEATTDHARLRKMDLG